MRRLDLKDVKFGKLFVVDYSHRKGKHLYWKCICDCGKETFQCTANLRGGKVVSCGCYRNEVSSERLSLIPRVKFEKGVASFNVLYGQYKNGAKRRGFIFELTKEDFKTLSSQNCHYCNIEPFCKISRRGVNGEYTYNGVDRKDSSIGYRLDNCIPCCTTCNLLKMDISYESFLNQIDKIYHNLRNKLYKSVDLSRYS